MRHQTGRAESLRKALLGKHEVGEAVGPGHFHWCFSAFALYIQILANVIRLDCVFKLYYAFERAVTN